MINAIRIRYVAALLVVPFAFSVSAQTTGTTSGTCSPNFVSSKIDGNITLNCALGREDLKKISESLNILVKQNKIPAQQTGQLLALMNDLLAVKSMVAAQTDSINRILGILQSGSPSEVTVGRVQEVLKSSLERTQQRVGPLKITLMRIEGSAGNVSIYFQVVNEGIQDLNKVVLFGPGSLGNGGSSIIAKGQEIPASRIDVAGQSEQGRLSVNNYIPGIPLNGRIDFPAHVDVGDVQVLRLAFAQQNIRPQGTAAFRLSR